jgi:hypothetical protein
MCYRRAHRLQRWGGESDLFTVSTVDCIGVKEHTLNLYAPSNAFAVLPVEVFALQDGPIIFVGEVLDVRKNPTFEGIRGNGCGSLELTEMGTSAI